MSDSFKRPRRRGRRTGVFATLAAVAAMLVSSIGAAPAQGQTTSIAWVPLACSVAGVIPAHVGAALSLTHPDTVQEGGTFELTDSFSIVIFPPAAQQAGAVFNGDAIQGIVEEFQTNLTNAEANFQTTAGGNPAQTSPTQFDVVKAVQPPNQAATGNPHINGNDTTRGGFQPSTPPEVFSFGDVPADTTGQSGNMFGPVPGVDGGPAPTDGTPDPLPPIGPLTVTGAAGDNVVIVNQNPGGPDVISGPTGNINFGPRIAKNTISFHQAGSGDPGTYSDQIPADCAFDETAQAVAKPVPEWIDELVLPIEGGPVDGVGTASARGTDPNGVQFSAITNCDETQSTRPFYVRWTENSTTHTFVKQTIDTSTCTSSGGVNHNSGTGTGTVDGSTPATLSWTFNDQDLVRITVTPQGGDPVEVFADPPTALNGTPGGVWFFGDLPWPPGTGT